MEPAEARPLPSEVADDGTGGTRGLDLSRTETGVNRKAFSNHRFFLCNTSRERSRELAANGFADAGLAIQ